MVAKVDSIQSTKQVIVAKKDYKKVKQEENPLYTEYHTFPRSKFMSSYEDIDEFSKALIK